MTLSFNSIVRYCGATVLILVISNVTYGHGIHGPDRVFIEASNGLAPAAFMYLGAKHMITGYDHLLYLAGVIFFISNISDIIRLVSIFALGHSITLLFGVLAGINVNPFLVDALIGLSVVYKGLENLNGFKLLGFLPSARIMVFLFGLVHGFGLASKLQEFSIASDGLVTNILCFNFGVEIGQLIALVGLYAMLSIVRTHKSFHTISIISNSVLMLAGFVLMAYQLAGYYYAQ